MRAVGVIVVGLLVLAGVSFAFDGALSSWVRGLGLGGDVRRELEAWQQYGQGLSVVVIALAIWLLDPSRRRRLLDYALALGLTAVVVLPMKMLVGRPRPKFDDPGIVLGPFGRYPIDAEVGVRHAWEVGSGISSDLWSLPSSHTAYAVVMSVFLAVVYPRVRWLVAALAGVVGLMRVWTGAHYPADVLVGAAVGLAVTWPVVRGYLGVRLLDAVWIRWIDGSAEPMYPSVAAGDAPGPAA